MSETKFLLDLVIHSSNPWHVYCLRTVSDQVWSFNVLERWYLDVDEMRHREATRLETMHALRLLKKVMEATAPKKRKKGRGKGRGKAKGRGRGLLMGPGSDSAETATESEDGPGPGAPDVGLGPGAPDDGLGPDEDGLGPGAPPAAPPEVLVEPPPLGAEVPPAPMPVGGRQRGEPWGTGNWELWAGRDRVTGVITGVGGTCRDHLDHGSQLVCKKNVSIGRSGLSYEVLRLRMKRWLVAGIDDESWPAAGKRTTHVGKGGRHFLEEFAEGLSEAECDRIANAG